MAYISLIYGNTACVPIVYRIDSHILTRKVLFVESIYRTYTIYLNCDTYTRINLRYMYHPPQFCGTCTRHNTITEISDAYF